MQDESKKPDSIAAGSDASREVPSTSAPVAPTPWHPTPRATQVSKAKDVVALRDAVVNDAAVGVGLWLSYLFMLLYLIIAVGGVTHRDLLFEQPVKLPFLGVDLPLVGFFVMGPGLFLIVHAYVLLHFVLLAAKVGFFDTELREQISDESQRTDLRRQLPSNILVQFLAGPREARMGPVGFLLRLITQISLVAAPLALTVFFLFQFLPYHHEPIAWWQRIIVVADLLLLWILWPSIARGQMAFITWSDLRRPRVALAALASVTPIMLIFSIATFPGEWLDKNLPAVRFIPAKEAKDGSRRWVSLHELLVAGDVDLVARKPTSLWSNVLVLPGVNALDHAKFDTEAKIAAVPETLSLRGRRLEGAILVDARLRKVDLTAAQLQGAFLISADLRQAKLGCASGQFLSAFRDSRSAAGTMSCTQLQGATLNEADLRGVNAEMANFEGASLLKAQLQDARLTRANLRNVSFERANLRGALDRRAARALALRRRNSRCASLEGANLRGAPFKRPSAGAMLKSAQLQGAYLVYTKLQVHISWRGAAGR